MKTNYQRDVQKKNFLQNLFEEIFMASFLFLFIFFMVAVILLPTHLEKKEIVQSAGTISFVATLFLYWLHKK